MADIWKIDTCDSCTNFTLTKNYTYKNDLFIWCDDCADEEATENPLQP